MVAAPTTPSGAASAKQFNLNRRNIMRQIIVVLSLLVLAGCAAGGGYAETGTKAWQAISGGHADGQVARGGLLPSPGRMRHWPLVRRNPAIMGRPAL